MGRFWQKKKPRIKGSTPQLQKQPQAIARSSEHLHPRWLFQLLDLEGPFGWHRASAQQMRSLILEHIRSLETTTWADHGKRGSHLLPVESLCKEAQERLVELGQDDIDEVYSLRFGGQKRIIGIRDNDALKVLWWDPEHQVCPSPKRHT